MCDGRIPRSQRLPRNPLNGQVPAWNSGTNQWEAVNQSGGSGLPDGTNEGDIPLWDSINEVWKADVSPFASKVADESILGNWLFDLPVNFNGQVVDPGSISSPAYGFKFGADMNDDMFVKNTTGGIIRFRTSSISSDVTYNLPNETGTLAMRGKTGIHFDADANISASLQVLKDPANNSLPISVSTGQVFIAGTLIVDSDIKFNNNLGYGIKSANDQRVLNVYNGLITSIGTNWAIGHTSASARIHVRGDGTNPITRWEDSTGNLFWSLTADATMLRMGGSTTSFPAIRRSGTSVELILANGTGYSALTCGAINVNGYGFVQLSTRYFIDQDSRGVAFGASVAIKGGNNAVAASSILDIESTTKGVLIPRMTTAQRDAIAAPAESLKIYNLTTKQHQFWNGAAWKSFLTD